MSHLHVKYLLIGGGVASLSAARAIRETDPTGSILMAGQEATRPYQRTAVSKTFLRRQRQRSELFAVGPSWFDEHHVDLRTGRRAVRLDVNRMAAAFDTGEEVSFDRLLIATGALPKHLDVPGADLPNVYSLRTLDDAERVHHAIDLSQRHGHRPLGEPPTAPTASRGRATVIGAGLLGVEIAASLRTAGLTVDLVEAGRHPWSRFAGDATGRAVSRYLEKRQITLHVGTRVQRLAGDGRVQRVILDGGRDIPCDLAIVAVGSVVPRDLLRGTPIASESAVLVDEHCRTNVPGVFAAGDCCAVFDPLFGKHRWLDYLDTAAATGRIAGTNMAAATAPEAREAPALPPARYEGVSYFYSEFFDVRLSGWGEARFVDRRVIRGVATPDALDLVEIGIAADGRVAQVLAVNHAGEDDVLRELVARRVQVNGHEEQLKDPAIRLTDVLGP